MIVKVFWLFSVWLLSLCKFHQFLAFDLRNSCPCFIYKWLYGILIDWFFTNQSYFQLSSQVLICPLGFVFSIIAIMLSLSPKFVILSLTMVEKASPNHIGFFSMFSGLNCIWWFESGVHWSSNMFCTTVRIKSYDI